MNAIRSNAAATPGKTAGKKSVGMSINAVNTITWWLDSKSAGDGYNLLTSRKCRKTRLDNGAFVGVFLGVHDRQATEKKQYYQTLRQ